MKYLLVFLILSQTLFASEEDWGQNGHRVVGETAESYLKSKVSKKIDRILNGQSLADASTYADEIKSDSAYDQYKPWHYANIPFDQTYKEAEKNPEGDIVYGIEECISKLKSGQLDKEQEQFYLRMLIHLVGDMHQPLHFGLKEDKGANDFKVKWFYQPTNLHSVWDTKMIESYNMSYTELYQNSPELSKTKVKAIESGTLLDWVEQNRELTRKVYTSAEAGENLSYRYMYEWFNVVELQMKKAGIRLAVILNDIYA
ncbi:S1/P1 nuclease [Psychroflexus sp. CAK57W]|uniref:S1/P1 nuclease n=1 Tax=Psychroflexus curvus TaxID=2873595 RepID=UPI001CCF3577|nr:S1/P1 nuclease [Psychroflexus curvus]MBZ9627751.1 S1/P1 nuclease [Psychroflexus curvus]MBZ9787428.1 S1/P1 nuclease [Psychroflexus curvus]